MSEEREGGLVLVTGGNSGIGYECARRLVAEGRSVLIASRNAEASARAVERIRGDTGRGAVEALSLDLGSCADVRRFVKEIEARDLRLRALVCNAGLQMARGPVLSPDGMEITVAVNHLGHFLLVNLLLERLLAHAPARILVVSSGVHDPAMPTGMPKPNVDDVETLAATGGTDPARYDGRLAYVHSKLCNLWFTYELVRRLEAAGLGGGGRALSVNAFEPGLVPGSGLGRDYPASLRFVWERLGPPIARVLAPFVATINTAEHSGSALAAKVLDPDLERVSGLYFPSHTRFREGAPSEAARDPERARALWEASMRWSGLTPEESPLVGRGA